MTTDMCGRHHDPVNRYGLYVLQMTTDMCGRNHDPVNRYGLYVLQMTTDMFHLSLSQSGPFHIHA